MPAVVKLAGRQVRGGISCCVLGKEMAMFTLGLVAYSTTYDVRMDDLR
jgi:hypothetical protein